MSSLDMPRIGLLQKSSASVVEPFLRLKCSSKPLLSILSVVGEVSPFSCMCHVKQTEMSPSIPPPYPSLLLLSPPPPPPPCSVDDSDMAVSSGIDFAITLLQLGCDPPHIPCSHFIFFSPG